MNIVNIYFIKHNEITQDLLGAAGNAIAPHYSNAISAVKNQKRKVELYCSGTLLKKCLQITSDEQFHIDENGCLSYPDGSRNFCLSHARDYTILAVSDDKNILGADIEEIPDNLSDKARHHREITAKRVLIPSLLSDYYAASLDEPVVFSRLWTTVEAVLKADGSGFYKDPLKNPELFDTWICKHIKLANHMIAVAMKNDDFTLKLNHID